MESITAEPPQYDVLFKNQDFPDPLPTPKDIERGEPLPGRQNGSTSLVRIRDNFVMKYGVEVKPIEAQNMLYVAKHTSLVVPKVYAIYQGKVECGVITYILMQYMPGKTLKDLWPELDKTRKTSIAKTLRASFQQLRQLQHPGYFGDINGGPPLDDMFTRTPAGVKNVTSPIATEEELINSFVRIFDLETGAWSNHKAKYYQHVLPTVLQSNNGPVFTHNDFQRKNIIVQDDGTVVIIDWEFSSWLPVYWEYSNAMFANSGWRDDWDEYLRIILDQYPGEALWICTMKTEMCS
ncbi:hypothetical protein FAUST_2237 [Fusarium austroamericanum]|uniref:Aminoglycoside phosphotransferase domain-containing protein n=1 Tax=Fusarium austroamericanum TaxID=282268 RepID=A0AAN6HIY9_FUSAU|nr:hypothetical protein FAUST_2237 [Fusarium austroamericanum]